MLDDPSAAGELPAEIKVLQSVQACDQCIGDGYERKNEARKVYGAGAKSLVRAGVDVGWRGGHSAGKSSPAQHGKPARRAELRYLRLRHARLRSRETPESYNSAGAALPCANLFLPVGLRENENVIIGQRFYLAVAAENDQTVEGGTVHR